ncbi:MAG TPA: amino acid racemase [Anaerolineae bacterium]
MEEKIVGVVAGAGPFAGLDLLSKILNQTAASRDQDHLAVVSLSRPSQIPDRTEYLLGRTNVNPAHAIAGQALQLERLGAAVAAIPCNTAHAPPIFDVVLAELQAANSRVNFLHMIEEVGAFLGQEYAWIKRVGVLSTTGTYWAKIYPNRLRPAGFDVVVPDEDVQEQVVHPAVYDPAYGIKATGSATKIARNNLLYAVQHLRHKGAEAVILGCTEMPLALRETAIDDVIIIDPTLILARALIREANPAKLKPLRLAIAD